MSNLLNPEDLISQAEAAQIRGVTRASINELIKRGRLRPVEIGGKTLLYRSEVVAFEPEKGGRPATKHLKPTNGERRATGHIRDRNGASTGKKKSIKR